MSADAVVFATNGSGGGDTKATAGTAMRDARKYLSNVEGTARTCTQVSERIVVRIGAAGDRCMYLLDELTWSNSSVVLKTSSTNFMSLTRRAMKLPFGGKRVVYTVAVCRRRGLASPISSGFPWPRQRHCTMIMHEIARCRGDAQLQDTPGLVQGIS